MFSNLIIALVAVHRQSKQNLQFCAKWFQEFSYLPSERKVMMESYNELGEEGGNGGNLIDFCWKNSSCKTVVIVYTL